MIDPPQFAELPDASRVHLDRLTGSEGPASSASGDDRVPGASLPPGSETLHPTSSGEDLAALASELFEASKEETSALARARALLVAAELWAEAGHLDPASSAAEEAARIAPKCSLAALLARRLPNGQNDETRDQFLEATARLGAHPATRAHAALLLSDAARRRGEIERASTLLDHVARSGSTDPRVALGRLALRLASGQTVTGVDGRAELRASAVRVGEVFGGRPSDAPTRAVSTLRVARALERASAAEAAELLLTDERAAFRELGLSLLPPRSEGRSRWAEARTKRRVASSDARLARRDLAAALEDRDFESARALLDELSPEATPAVWRAFASRLAERPFSPRPEDEPELERENPILLASLGLGAREHLADPRDASLRSLELGAALALPSRRTRSIALEAGANGRDQLLATLFALDDLLDRGEFAAAGELLARRSFDEPEIAVRARWVSAWLFERAGETARALDAYRTLRDEAARSPEVARFRLALDRALDRLDPESSGNRPSASDSSPRDEESELLDALRAGDDESRRLLGLAERWTAPFLPLVAALAADRRGFQEESLEALRRLEASSDPILAAHAELRLLLVDAPDDPRELTRFAERLESRNTGPLDASWLESSWFGPRRRTDDAAIADSVWLSFERAALDWVEGRLESALATLASLPSGAKGEFSAHAENALADATLDPIRLGDPLLARAKSEDPRARSRAYERLAELDLGRGNRPGALLWLRTQIEEAPTDPALLLRLEDHLLAEGRADELAALRERLAKVLPVPDRDAYALWNGALALGRSDTRAARRHLEPVLERDEPSLFALRLHVNGAIEKNDDASLVLGLEKLFPLVSTDLDRATIALSLAYASSRLGRAEQAREWVRAALEVRDDLFAPSLFAARLAAGSPDAGELGRRLTHLGEVAKAPRHRAHVWLETARLRRDDDFEGAVFAYRRALEAEPDRADAFTELSDLLLDDGQLEQLGQLIEARLALIQDPKERVELELRLADVLVDRQLASAARAHVEKALQIAPKDPRALRAHAALCLDLEDYRAVEISLVRLRDLLQEGPEFVAVQRSLGELYQDRLGSPEKALDSLEVVLAATPNDASVARRLVAVFAELGRGEDAATLQTRIIQTSTSDDEKRRGALLLADLYERVLRDPVRAGATLERTRKAWPLDAEVLGAQAHFLDRQGEAGARRLLVDRVGKEAYRSLQTGRLEARLFDTLAEVAELSEHPSQKESILAARAAFLGEPAHLAGAGLRALDPALDELLAPNGLSSPLRHLLRKAGPAFDLAFSVDLSALRATRLTGGVVTESLTRIAEALGAKAPEVFVAESLGSRCMPYTMNPLRFVVGPELERLPSDARDYLMVRATKLQILGAGALARSRPEDSWSMLAALLLLFSPNFRPKAVDARKVAQSRALVEQGLARVGYDDDVPTLALEAIGALGDHGEHLGHSVRALASRAALLALGSPAPAIVAIGEGADKSVPAHGPPRFRWFESHAEAKELLLYAVSDEHARARERLGLAEARAARAPAPPRAPTVGPRAPLPSIVAHPPREDAPPDRDRAGEAPAPPGAPPRRPPPRRG